MCRDPEIEGKDAKGMGIGSDPSLQPTFSPTATLLLIMIILRGYKCWEDFLNALLPEIGFKEWKSPWYLRFS